MSEVSEDRLNYLRTSIADKPFCKLLGISVLKVKEGLCVLLLPKKVDIIRPAGIFTGGALVSLMDICAGIAVASTGKNHSDYYVTTDLNTQFLRPAKGEYLYCKAQVVKQGAKISVAEVKIYSSEEQLISITENMILTTMGTFSFMKIN